MNITNLNIFEGNQMKRIIQEFIVSVISSVICCLGVGSLYQLFLSNFEKSDKDNVFVGVFIGLPLGSILGLYILRKILFKKQKAFTFLRILTAYVIALIIGLLGVISLDFTKYFFFALPVFISICFMMFLKHPEVRK
jgi:hypothetical protein